MMLEEAVCPGSEFLRCTRFSDVRLSNSRSKVMLEHEDAAAEGAPSEEELRESQLSFERYREWEKTAKAQSEQTTDS